MRPRHMVALGACLALSSCLRLGAFQCDGDDACRSRGEQGVCQASRYCSYPDTTCESGQRYDEFASDALADQCVEPDPIGTTSGGSSSDEGSSSSSTSSTTGRETTESSDTGSPDPVCGNGIVEEDEVCDDGNEVDGDGCNVGCVESGTVLWDVVHPEFGTVARGVAVGPSGNVAVVGGRVEDGQSDIMVLLYDPDGTAQWQRLHGSPADNTDEGRQVIFDGAGNVYATAYETRGDLMPPQGNNAWTRRYDGQGAEAWTESYDGPSSGNDRAYDIEWRGDTVVVAGHSAGDFWMREYATRDGEIRWTYDEGIDPMRFDQALSIAVDADGIYAAGSLNNADGGEDGWFARFSVTGEAATQDWVEVIDPGGREDDEALGIDVAPDGALIVGGRRGGLAWLAKFTPDGTLDWERFDETLQVPSDVRGVAVDTEGQVIAVGYETDPKQGEDAFVTKYDPDGTTVWTRRYDGPAGGTDRARAVAVAPDRTIAVSGFTDAVDGRRLWVRKYAP